MCDNPVATQEAFVKNTLCVCVCLQELDVFAYKITRCKSARQSVCSWMCVPVFVWLPTCVYLSKQIFAVCVCMRVSPCVYMLYYVLR